MSEELNGRKPKDKKLSRLSRLIQRAIGDDTALGRDDDPAATKFPDLWEWLTRTEADRDHLKQPATLSISAGPDGILIRLTDRDLGYSLDAPCCHLEQAFEAIDGALRSDISALRSWGKGVKQLRKRRPKP